MFCAIRAVSAVVVIETLNDEAATRIAGPACVVYVCGTEMSLCCH